MAFYTIILILLISSHLMTGFANISDTCNAGEYQCRTCQNICQKCPLNTYSHVGHLSQCIPCPRYHRTAGEGSTSRLDCALPTKCDHEVEEYIRQCDATPNQCSVVCSTVRSHDCQVCTTEPSLSGYVCQGNGTMCTLLIHKIVPAGINSKGSTTIREFGSTTTIHSKTYVPITFTYYQFSFVVDMPYVISNFAVLYDPLLITCCIP